MRAIGAVIAAGLLAFAGCGSDGEKTSSGGGGSSGTGGASGTSSGGVAGTSAGAAQGGATTGGGGSTSSGGSETGGSTSQGGDSGTTSTGGSATGGSGGDAGGSATGGAGGSGTGGSATGGSATGGASGGGSGGSAAGGGSGGTATGGSGGAPTGSLEIYFVDTEGGQATVISLPGGQVMIVDTGNSGTRDADRIQAVLRDELSKTTVDYLVTTHYDSDHVGGATTLNQRSRVQNFLDHGDQGAPSSYLTMANAGMRRVIAPGNVLDVGGVHFDFVSSAGNLITAPLPGGGANPNCSGVQMKGESDENRNSVGFIMRFGTFDFIDLGDLLWDWELRLACPTNLLGQVDLYLTTHHGLTRSGAPPLVRGIAPLAAVMNNGPRKGGGGSTWTTLTQSPGGMEVWQLHQALASPASENAPADQIANPGEGGSDMAFFLKVTARSNGAFTIENPRNMVSRTYQSR
jgi:beta-lactamase superfamily II metal-dependent hydrolase